MSRPVAAEEAVWTVSRELPLVAGETLWVYPAREPAVAIPRVARAGTHERAASRSPRVQGAASSRVRWGLGPEGPTSVASRNRADSGPAQDDALSEL